MSVYKEDMDVWRCTVPNCEHRDHSIMWIHARCHPEAPVQVCYVKERGVLRVECLKCKRLIVEVAVAPQPVHFAV
jgi:hypothetical protein